MFIAEKQLHLLSEFCTFTTDCLSEDKIELDTDLPDFLSKRISAAARTPKDIMRNASSILQPHPEDSSDFFGAYMCCELRILNEDCMVAYLLTKNAILERVSEIFRKIYPENHNRIQELNRRIAEINNAPVGDYVNVEVCQEKKREIRKLQAENQNKLLALKKVLLEKIQNLPSEIANTFDQFELRKRMWTNFKETIFNNCSRELIENLNSLNEHINHTHEVNKQESIKLINVAAKKISDVSRCDNNPAHSIKKLNEMIEIEYAKMLNPLVLAHYMQLSLFKELIKRGHVGLSADQVHKLIVSIKAELDSLKEFYRKYTTLKDEVIPSDWRFTDWGNILINSEKGMISGASFSMSLDQQIRFRSHAQTFDEVNNRNRIVCHMVLVRMISEINLKQRLLRKGPGVVTEQQRVFLNFELNLLNEQYRKVFRLYCFIPQQTLPLLSAASKHVWDQAVSIVSFGYIDTKFLTPVEFRREKQLADLGYEMLYDVRAWLDTLRVPDDQTIFQVLKKEVSNFLSWADNDPVSATALATDVALTCSIIGGQSYMDQFIAAMRVKAICAAFRQGLNSDEDDHVISPESLKYYSLAHLCRWAPLAGSVIAEFNQRRRSGPIQSLFNVFTRALQSSTIQNVVDFAPEVYANLALHFLNIVKGKDFIEIVEDQRNLELVRLAGVAKDLMSSPTSFVKRIQYEASVWYQTLLRSQTTEKVLRVAAQVFLPTAALLTAISLTVTSFSAGLIVWAATASFSITLLSMALSTARYVESIFNTYFPTNSTVVESFKNEAKAKARAKISSDVKREALKFIKDLRTNKTLPAIPQGVIEFDEIVSEEQFHTAKNEIVNSLIANLEQAFRCTSAPSAAECVKQCIQSIEQVGNLIIALKEASPNFTQKHLRAINSQVAFEIINKWLQPKIEEIFTDQAIEQKIERKDTQKVKGVLKEKLGSDYKLVLKALRPVPACA